MKNPNYTNYSYQELVHQLDMHTTDPLVRRLIDMIIAGENSILEQLIEEGMDPIRQTFYYDGQDLDVGFYIHSLRQDCDMYEQEMRIAQEERDSAVEERDRLKTRSVADLLSHMQELVRRAHAETVNAQQIARKVEQENVELKDKINVWKVMES